MKRKEEKKRIYYDKNFKNLFLYKLSKDENPEKIITENGYDIKNLLLKDKKYLSKLIHKWKKDLLESNLEIANFKNQNLTSYNLLYEINSSSKENENDILFKTLKEKEKNYFIED